MISAVEWTGTSVRLINQTVLPARLEYEEISTIEGIFDAIKNMHVRGAPAIGITAAYGLYLGIKDFSDNSKENFLKTLEAKARYLEGARPTAVNLHWALQTILDGVKQEANHLTIPQLKERVLAIAQAIHDDDRRRCQAIGEHGAALLPLQSRILTHCNTGALATGGIGTALGIIYVGFQQGKVQHVYVDETRPVLQGARLTAWELQQANIPYQLITDNMAGWVMQQGLVDAIIVGADRITRDGFVANKIGTYSLAVLARHHNIPFYVAAPFSTIDTQIRGGESIPIEERDCNEVRKILNQFPIAPENAPCYNPAFDVTPPHFIKAIITEAGVIEPPFEANIQKFYQKQTIHFTV